MKKRSLYFSLIIYHSDISLFMTYNINKRLKIYDNEIKYLIKFNNNKVNSVLIETIFFTIPFYIIKCN